MFNLRSNMNIQYVHNREFEKDIYEFDYRCPVLLSRGGETIAFEVPEPWVIEALTIGDFLTKLVGKAKCSDEDNYSKKIGRELASSRMKATVLTVVRLENYGELRTAVLEDSKGHKYYIEKAPNYTKVHFTLYE
jgi:hypothetical protein